MQGGFIRETPRSHKHNKKRGEITACFAFFFFFSFKKRCCLYMDMNVTGETEVWAGIQLSKD